MFFEYSRDVLSSPSFGRLAFLTEKYQPVVLVETYVVFAVFLAEVVVEEKTHKLTNFHSVEAAHSYAEHVAVVFLRPGGLVIRECMIMSMVLPLIEI